MPSIHNDNLGCDLHAVIVPFPAQSNVNSYEFGAAPG